MTSANPSIAQDRAPVNSLRTVSPADPRVIAKERAQARMRVRGDGALSLGARCFYCALDDWALSHGFTEMKRAAMADGLQASIHSITDWTAELLARGYISQERGRHGSRLMLFWKDSRSAENELLARPEVQILPLRSAENELLAVQDTPSLTPKRSIKGSKGGWVNTAPPLPEKRPPARSSPRIEELGEALREMGYQPDRALLERLGRSIPQECSIAAAVAVLRRRIFRPRSKALTQPMLPVFFAEDVPAKWQAEAAILDREQAERVYVAELDRKAEAQDRIEAQGIIDRGSTDPLEREWARMVLEPVGWAATA